MQKKQKKQTYSLTNVIRRRSVSEWSVIQPINYHRYIHLVELAKKLETRKEEEEEEINAKQKIGITSTNNVFCIINKLLLATVDDSLFTS